MVVDYPDNTCQKFFIYDNLAFGPIDSNAQYVGFLTELPVENSTVFSEKRGIFGDNNVEHSVFDGTLYYFPILADCIPRSQAGYPRKIDIPCVESPYFRTSMYGFACPDIGLHVYSSTQQVHVAIRRFTNPTRWEIMNVTSFPNNPRLVVCSFKVVTPIQWVDPTKLKVRILSRTGYGSSTPSFDTTKIALFEQIQNQIDAQKKWLPDSTVTKDVTAFTTDPNHVMTPKQILEGSVSSMITQLLNSNFPIPEQHYGDLAVRAANQKRAIDSNMIAFLKDLKHIRDCIPKLSNLKSLKGMSSNYLAVNYGILPTVSDLKEIVGAFDRVRTYYDKNGFSTYSASHEQEMYEGNTFLRLEQHIKVAVDNEDSAFKKLCDDLDNIGMFPTFENIWDLVKYSFVVDWFVDIGGFLERVDWNLRLLRYNIPYVTMSRKKVINGEFSPYPETPAAGRITWRYYHRWVSAKCPLPPLALSLTPTVSNHWLEAGALIIQRAK